MMKLLSTLTLAAGLVAGSAQAVTFVTVEAPGVTSSTVSLSSGGTETFTGLPLGPGPKTTTFGGSPYGGAYNTLNVKTADIYGGAGGVGKYGQVSFITSLKITGGPVDYFGLYASALNPGNKVSFLKAGVLIDSFDLGTFPLPAAYFGNPAAPFLGAVPNEAYAFFNFNVIGGYDQVIFNRGSGLFEHDNDTVGILSLVPEPATWALMVTGFGLIGVGMRRRNRGTVAA